MSSLLCDDICVCQLLLLLCHYQGKWRDLLFEPKKGQNPPVLRVKKDASGVTSIQNVRSLSCSQRTNALLILGYG